MFDDPKKELDALEKQLLADEAWFEQELDSAKRMIGQNPRHSAAARTAQAAKPAPRQPRQPEREAPAPKKKSAKGLLILAAVEILGILGLAAYWVLFLLR